MPTNTTALKTFAQNARRQLREQVAARLEQVLRTDSVEIREQAQAVAELRKEIAATSRAAVMDKVAYTWFNRFCALRFMDVRHYNRVRAVSPQKGFTQPEILQEAKQGLIAENLPIDRQRAFDLLSGRLPSHDPQGEAYRLLLVGVCNNYHRAMPFLFEEIADYTELLMPEDLLSENSILHSMRLALNEAACQDVEVIGWLYQYYISERKDEVFAALKQRKKIEAEDIPAATQLFTPHWIVRYLVENSLGRLWMLNHPESRLSEQMEYYIENKDEGERMKDENGSSSLPPSSFISLDSPEELKICDPACGSGHMLTYAFDLLYAIYEEQGYDPAQIPRLILEKNLHGIEIDPRAGHLAAFALTMKARERDRRFFTRSGGRGVEPNICILQNVAFSASEIDEYMQAVGRDLFTQDLWLTLRQFEQAENFGSLIRPALKDVGFIRDQLEEKGVFGNMFLFNTNQKIEQVLEMAEYLSPRYHVVVANPPYMGSKGLNEDLKEFTKNLYPISKSDLFAMFIERNIDLVSSKGLVGMITMHSWMFISIYENLRSQLLKNECFLSMAHLGPRAFDTIGGEVVSTTSFVLQHSPDPEYKSSYLRLVTGNNETEKARMLKENIPTENSPIHPNYFRSSALDFIKIPGAPFAYWLSEKIIESFSSGVILGNLLRVRGGMTTANNDKFVRLWYETALHRSSLFASTIDATWFPYNKGGTYRKWYGNQLWFVNWKNDGAIIKATGRATIRSEDLYQKEMIGWTDISGFSQLGVRYYGTGFLFDASGPAVFPNSQIEAPSVLGFLGSKVVSIILHALNPTLHVQAGNISSLPWTHSDVINQKHLDSCITNLINISRSDWDSYEISWNFSDLPLIKYFNKTSLSTTYFALRQAWKEKTLKMQSLEEENNQILIKAYGLEDELAPGVSVNEITLTCNPHYRYDSKRSEEELDALLLADTMKEFISYAVGCMFGRYALDKPGLILANQGETLRDYLKQVPEPAFPADDDNVIPVLHEGWFDDDIVERFKRFLRVTFGDEHYEENLAFLEKAIGKDIRSYFLRDFYTAHIKMYKKRPIYWLFSSPKGSFNALIYMHRYRPDTVSVILNDYLREYREKITAHRAYLEQVSANPAAAQRDKTKAVKEIEKINKVLSELKEYEDEILYPLATKRIEIDLDDGVKVNYPKFGKALKKVSGLSG